MARVITIGLDIAKHVFQVHGVDGVVVVRQRLRRSEVLAFFEGLEPCLVGIEACATAHHWARALTALAHTAKLMPPSYVKPYVKRQKNDAADASRKVDPSPSGRRTERTNIPSDFSATVGRQPLSPIQANFQKYGSLRWNNCAKSAA